MTTNDMTMVNRTGLERLPRESAKAHAAFRTYLEIVDRLDDYPVLDEEDYCRREYEATLANFDCAVSCIRHDYELPEGWKEEVFNWFWQNDQRAVENRDDSGGYPNEEQLESAFTALGYQRTEE